MGQKENIKPCQVYRGYADIDSVEYKYPLKKSQKFVLRITLVGSTPRVWRELAVPSTIKLTSLAHVIILAMGWEESHLSMFKKWRKEYHVYMDGADMYDYPIEDASDYALCDLLAAGEEMTFTCPPNDVGGINGYKEMLRILKEEPDDEEAKEYYTWLGSKWNEKFFPAIDTAIALNELNHMLS